jgi:hypothetical protein
VFLIKTVYASHDVLFIGKLISAVFAVAGQLARSGLTTLLLYLPLATDVGCWGNCCRATLNLASC